MSDLRQIRYEAARPDLVDRMIDIVSARQGHAAAAIVEQAKIALTDRQEAAIEIALMGEKLRLPVTRDQLNEAIGSTVGRVQAAVKDTLADAGVAPAQITAVFLTGGSSAIPLLKESVLAMFPSAATIEGDMFGSVGLGLALDAQRKFGR